MSSKRSRLTDEQRREFAAMVIDDGVSFEDVATKAGVSIKTARTWVDKERSRRENPSSDTEYVASLLEEHRHLTAELKRLKEEVEFKKKAFAFFAAKLEDQ